MNQFALVRDVAKVRPLAVLEEQRSAQEEAGTQRAVEPGSARADQLVRVEQRVSGEAGRDRVGRPSAVSEESGLNVERVAPTETDRRRRAVDELLEEEGRTAASVVVFARHGEPCVRGRDQSDRFRIPLRSDSERRAQIHGRGLHRLREHATPDVRAEREQRRQRAAQRVVRVVAAPVARFSPRANPVDGRFGSHHPESSTTSPVRSESASANVSSVEARYVSALGASTSARTAARKRAIVARCPLSRRERHVFLLPPR